MSSATSFVEMVATWWRSRPRLLGEVRTSQEKALIEKWKRGIASALGVPREAIREDVADQYLGQWVRLLVKQDYWRLVGLEQEGNRVEQGNQATSTQEKQEASSKEASRKAKKIAREASGDGQKATSQ
jgi:hypothetical protein